MKDKAVGWYQASEFAELTGVTVRALHHYDRLGLLRPGSRTPAGYRLYSERDVARLEQIIALKFIGFSLKEIKTILDRNALDLPTMLRLQREIIARKRQHLDRAIAAIERAERRMRERGEADVETFKQIIEVMNMENNTNWMMQYYSEEARRKIEERAKDWTPEKQAKASADWAALFKDIKAAIAEGVDPASQHAQQLAARWDELIRGFTGGDPEVAAGLRRLYADQSNWPATFEKPFNDEHALFVSQARAHSQKES
ncbi:MAG: MerR family transcriptional regulator, thiopeptide resistance regulator [Blastocatellia bacterium]